MRSNLVRAIAGAAAVALILVLLVVLKDGSSEDSTSSPAASQPVNRDSGDESKSPKKKPEITTIVIRDGEPLGGVAELTYDQGDQVRFKVSSDVADEIHLHGYDISKDVDVGGSVTFAFPAEIEGIFELELEERAVQIAELTVNP